jgi:hypothetical protein
VETKKVPARAAGGLSRAKNLTPEKRKEIALKANSARWELRATHKGSFKDDFGIDAECYVLNDQKKTAVISKTAMSATLGLAAKSTAFPRFWKSDAMKPFAAPELTEKLLQPIEFKWSSEASPDKLFNNVHGYDVTILIDVCNTIIKAAEAGSLKSRQKPIVKQARAILSASAKSGIQNLVYKLAGYDATREEVVSAFKMFVREEAREYEREFPNQLYEEWYRLYQIPKPEKNKPWKFMHLTKDHVYKNLAKSRGKILELTQNQRAANDEPNKKLHQFLSDIGSKALRQHLGQLLGIAQISKDKQEYEKYVNKIFGEQLLLDI